MNFTQFFCSRFFCLFAAPTLWCQQCRTDSFAKLCKFTAHHVHGEKREKKLLSEIDNEYHAKSTEIWDVSVGVYLSQWFLIRTKVSAKVQWLLMLLQLRIITMFFRSCFLYFHHILIIIQACKMSFLHSLPFHSFFRIVFVLFICEQCPFSLHWYPFFLVVAWLYVY